MKREKFIESELSQAYYEALSNDLGFLIRDDKIPASTEVFDLFCYDWTLIIPMEVAEGQVVINGIPVVSESRKMALLVPPFTIAKWELKPGTIKWCAYSTKKAPPENISRNVSMFSWSESSTPMNHQELFSILEKVEDYVECPYKGDVGERARRSINLLKKYIDQNFQNEFNFDDLAGELGISRATMYRGFKKCFGISPAIYRRKLRVYNSTRYLLTGKSATEACFVNGFSDFSTFYRNFREITTLNPMSYSLK